jgi:Flp pilus assembly protein TadD
MLGTWWFAYPHASPNSVVSSMHTYRHPISGERMKPVQVLLVLLCAQGLVLACGSQPLSTPPSSEFAPLDTAQAYLQRGDSAADRHEYDRAIADYTQAIHAQPDYAEAYNNRGYAYYWQGLYPNAIADYDRAIALRPIYPYAYNNRGAAYMASGDSERAISDFDQALYQQPDLVQAYTNRGNAYLRMGRIAQARADFRHVGQDPVGWLIGACLVPLLLVVLVVVLIRRRSITQAGRKRMTAEH